MNKRTIINTDGIKTMFLTDDSFLEYVRDIYRENEMEGASEIHWLPENTQQAAEYIVEYTELELIES